nr:NAD(+) kinase [Candidatus Cloacimonadota bacterium]
NLGKLGFLSDIGMREMEKSLDELIHNRYKIQKRMLLKVTLKREGKILFSDRALNDAVLYKGETPRLTEIKVYSNKQFVLDTRCDGVVVSSPTGSTAYSLSAGGPLLSPVMDAIIVAPLNPHILSVRPMVFAATDKLSFRIMESHADCVLQLDGRNAARLQEADEITVSSDSRKLEMIKLSNKTFYQILRTKLNMGRK